MRIVFFGTPEFAIPTLESLARAHEVALVVAQPDKRAGRGLHLQSPAIARKAKELGLSLAQPGKIRDALHEIEALRPDVGVVIAYGKILPAELLQIPRHGFLNVHASILPKYRGAAPIQRAIEHGETGTGVTIMRVDEELDHGPILDVRRAAIGADEHAPVLTARLSQLGTEALLQTLESDIDDGTPQDHGRATYAPKIKKQEGQVRWTDSTATIYNKYRAFDPWPGVFTREFKLIEIEPVAGSGAPGTILSIDERGVTVATGDGAIRLLVLQRAGRARQSATDFARGSGWRVGAGL